MAYSIDLRKKVVDYRKTHTYEQTYQTFKVSITTIIDWETLLEETGSLEKRPLNRGHKKIDPAKLAEYIVEFPDAYLQEIADHFGCTATAVFYALEKEKITLKKLKFVTVKQMKKNAKLSEKLWPK
jgi:transposase